MTQLRSSDDIQVIGALSDLNAQYRAILCDIWGVVHNGQEPFARAVAALQDFRGDGGIVVMVSNSPRPSDAIPAQFEEIGVPTDAYDGVVTSGDFTRSELKAREGQKFHHIGPPRDGPLTEGIAIEKAPIVEAEFVLCSGLYDDENETPDDYGAELAAIRSRDLLMICANPDIVVKRGDKLIYCGGAIAAAYEDLGGRTLYGGKPHAPIYELATRTIDEIAGTQISREKLLMIGDGPKTDIYGAERFGIDSLFIGGGIHAEESFLASGDLNRPGLAALFGELDIWPHYVMPWLA